MVFAEESANSTTQASNLSDKASNATEILLLIEKLMYVILWPIMYVAGKMIDNSMIYGSWF